MCAVATLVHSLHSFPTFFCCADLPFILFLVRSSPLFGEEGRTPTVEQIQSLKNDAMWFLLPSEDVKVNPFWAGWNPLSSTGPSEEAKAK